MTAGSERQCAQCGLELPPTGPCPHCLLRLALGEDPASSFTEPPGRPPTGLHSRFFGDYELLDELARGGMGVVYRARQLSLKRIVALKMVHASHLNSPEARSRFALEVDTAAQLSHPNIVALYESGEFKGTHFFTMRLVEGGDLAQHIKARRTGEAVPTCAMPPLRSPETIAALIIKAARALHHAHAQGILHRDIKPSNILIDQHGEPHLVDFGLAKLLAHDSANTHTNSVLGSPNYMAPEQASGRNNELTAAVDVYGLGAVLYEALTGVPPFQAATPVETIRKVIDEDPIAPRRLQAGIDPDLETICLKCLEKKPGARYGAAEQLAADLERWRDGRPILARPLGLWGTFWRWSRRRPAMAGLSAALGVALLAIVVVVGTAVMRIRQAEQQAVAHLREALIGQAHALSLSPERGARGETLRLVERALGLGGPPEFRRRARDQLLAGLALTDLTFSPQMSLPEGDDVKLTALDPAMTRWAVVQNRTNVVLRPASEAKPAGLLRAASPLVRLEGFSADGRFLAYRDEAGLGIWDTKKAPADALLWRTNGRQRAFCFSRMDPRVMIGEDDGTLSVRELPTWREVSRVTPPPGRLRRRAPWQLLSWSPDGRWLAGVRMGEGALELLEVATGHSQWRVTTVGRVAAIAWALERECLAVGASDGSIRLLPFADGSGTLLHTAANGIREIAVSEAASLLAAKGEDGVLNVFDLYDLPSKHRLFFGKFEAHGLRFDPDGTRLGPVQRGTEVGWIDLASSAEFRQFTVAGGSVERCQFSPDSQILIGASAATLALRRAADGSALDKISAGPLAVFTFDPIGEVFLTSDAARGVRRWALPETALGQRTLQPPQEILPMPWTARSLVYSADGQRLAVAYPEYAHAVVFDRGLTNPISTLGPHEDVWEIALSPDGRKAATAGGGRAEIRIWDVARHQLEATLPAGRRTRVEFSSDGRWLIGHGDDGFALWSSADWKPGPALPFAPEHVVRSAAAFSADARILAVAVEGFEVQLFDLQTWQPIGLLRSPTSRHCRSLAFSPDGTRLAAGCTRGVMRLWALDEIRSQMKKYKLDWEMPPLPSHRREPSVELKRVF